jgi:hypothetical protein
MKLRIGCVVEGHGEVKALPVLLRRLGNIHEPPVAVEVRRPVRLGRSKALAKPEEFERAVALAALNAGPDGAVLVVLDADNDCPAQLAPQLLKRARNRIAGDVPLSVVIAKREFESWFLAALASLRGQRGIADEAEMPAQPEAIRGAKEWLSRCMSAGRTYRESLDQPALAAVFDLEQAKSAPSFCKLLRDFESMCRVAARE